MGGLVVLLLLLLFGGGLALFYLKKNKETTPVDVPISPVSIPSPPPASEPWGKLESAPKSDDFVPQETIYTYYNPKPGTCCPVCDAESPAGMSYCQVCGSSIGTHKYR